MFDREYVNLISGLITTGAAVKPRGQETRERIGGQLYLHDSSHSLLNIPERHLNFRYAVAEWLWVQFGRSDVASIKQYNAQLLHFTDDGIWFTGAYGPHIGGHWQRCVGKLMKDPLSRQAVLQIPRPNQETKDEPCTLSLQFLIRWNRLHCVVTMRSSDVWLGLPYDVFTFSQIQNVMAGELGVRRGSFLLNAGSSHLYERDFAKALAVCHSAGGTTERMPDLPGRPPAWLEDVLVAKDLGPVPSSVNRESDPWMRYAYALVAPSWGTALWELRRPEGATTVRATDGVVH